MDVAVTDEPAKQDVPRSLWSRILFAVQHMFVRAQDYLSSGFDARRRHIHIPGRVFDEAWYLENNADVAGYDGSFEQHFFLHGIDEGRKARFFDSHWYYRNHKDSGLLRMDAWTHYCRFGIHENRAARFLYIHGGVERPINRNYGDWVWQFDTLNDRKVQNLHGLRLTLGLSQKFSVVAALSDSDSPELIRRVVKAIKDQIYETFEAILAVTPAARSIVEGELKGDKRFTLINTSGTEAESYSKLLEAAKTDHVAFMRSCDILDPAALVWVAYGLHERPQAQVFYADEDRMDTEDLRKDPYFKPDFNYELFLTHNMLGGFTVYRRDLIEAVGGIDPEAGDDALYDLALRVYEQRGGDAFVHIPRVLNHVRGRAVYREAQVATVNRHLKRLRKSADVMKAPELEGYNRVRYALPKRLPKVSILIPTRDKAELLRFCLGSLLEKTSYTNYEVIIIDNGSVEPETFAYFEEVKADKRVRVIRDERPFNFSQLNNKGVAQAKGSYVCLMNNDIEILTPDWLEEMVSFAQQPDVGCVGARLWYPDDTLQHGGVLIGFFDVAGHMHKHIKRGETGYANRASLHQSLSAVTAAVLLIRKETYNAVGGLDEGLAVAFNDVDFCLRVRDAGYRNIYTPYAEMYHHESASRGAEDSPEKKAREQREIQTIKTRYGQSMRQCPAFSPNLSLTSEDMSFAFPPRVPTVEDILIDLREAERQDSATSLHKESVA